MGLVRAAVWLGLEKDGVHRGSRFGQVSVKEETREGCRSSRRWKGLGDVALSRLLTLPTHNLPLYSLSIKQIVVKGTELS